jgi:hypothetical protein
MADDVGFKQLKSMKSSCIFNQEENEKIPSAF